MSYVKHHAIVVTSVALGDQGAALTRIHNMAQRIGLGVTPITASLYNAYSTFLVIPDGSNEGWPESLASDSRRAAFKALLDEDAYTCLDWVEISYSPDDGVAEIIDTKWKQKRH